MNLKKEYFVAPSLLSADFSNIKDAVKLIEKCKGDWIHLDVMDGSFVQNLTFGPKLCSDIRPLTKLPIDVHLMVDNPQNLIPDFVKSGADYITFHYESIIHVHKTIQLIKSFNKKAGIAIVPSTSVKTISEILSYVDIVLVMTVNPGFGGQKLIPQCLEKIKLLSQLKKDKGYSYLISVDGGLNRKTVSAVRASGADVLVSGSSFFSSSYPEEEILFFKGNKSI